MPSVALFNPPPHTHTYTHKTMIFSLLSCDTKGYLTVVIEALFSFFLLLLLPGPLEVITKPALSQNSVGGGVVRKRYNGSKPKKQAARDEFHDSVILSQPSLLNGHDALLLTVINQMLAGLMQLVRSESVQLVFLLF